MKTFMKKNVYGVWFYFSRCLFLCVQSQINYEGHYSSSSSPSPLLVGEPKLEKSINLALTPIENDLLNMNIKHGGEDAYNIHELPQSDGKTLWHYDNCKVLSITIVQNLPILWSAKSWTSWRWTPWLAKKFQNAKLSVPYISKT